MGHPSNRTTAGIVKRLSFWSRIQINSSFRRRLVDWFVLALVLFGGGYLLELAFARPVAIGLLGAKLTFLSVATALGMFQYRGFLDMMNSQIDRLHSPEWTRYEQKARATGPPALDDPHVKAELARWEAYKAEIRALVRDNVIPHSEALIANTFVIAGCLLISLLADAAMLYAGRDVYAARVASTTFLGASLLPFVEGLIRYVIAFHYELSGYRELFAETRADEP
jgi:hypothetical protein